MAKPREYTINGLSSECGIDRRTLARLLENVTPVHRDGKDYYRVREVCNALRGGGVREQESERTRLFKIQADEAELRLLQRQGEVIPVEVVKKEWTEVLMSCRARLLGLPARMAQAVSGLTEPREIEEMLRTEIYGALSELSDEYKGVAESGRVGDEPAAASERKRVGRKGSGSQSGGKRRTGEVAKREGAAPGRSNGRAESERSS